MSLPEYAVENLHQTVDELVAAYFGDDENVGLAVGVIAGGERHVFGYGRLAKDRDDTPDEHTVFEIGSVTKVFTANLLAQMAGRGEVGLHDPVAKHLPESVRVPDYRGEPIALYHLATHTSALPRLPHNLDASIKDEANPYAGYTVEHLYQCLNDTRLRRPPGRAAAYSNLGAGLLGHILSRVVGKPYEDLVRERVCGPLRLNDTAVALSGDQQRRMARGHSGGQQVANWDLPTLAGAGALRSTVAEMLTYLAANLRPADSPLKDPLALCHVRHELPRSARRLGWSMLWPVVLVAISLLVQRSWPLPPGSGAFLVVFSLPVVLCGLFGGFASGLAATLLAVAGTALLWGKSFGWFPSLVGGVGISIALGWLRWWATGDPAWAAWPSLVKPAAYLGWHEQTVGGARALWHNGGTGGYCSFVGFVPESQVAVAVLSNSDNSVDDIGAKLLEHLHKANAIWLRVPRSHRRVIPGGAVNAAGG